MLGSLVHIQQNTCAAYGRKTAVDTNDLLISAVNHGLVGIAALEQELDDDPTAAKGMVRERRKTTLHSCSRVIARR